MDKQNPFSIYDFLGYFIPGALVIYILIIFYTTKDINNFENFKLLIENDKAFELDKFLFFIIISYSLGHLINFMSSITIERYSNWKYNYPSKYLMDFNEDFKFWNGSNKIKLWKTILLIILLPITFWDLVLGNFFEFKNFYTKKADVFIIDVVKVKGIKLLEKIGAPHVDNLRDHDFHRIFSHYVYENSKHHQSKLTNYVALYGFLRSLSLIFNIMHWLLIIKLGYNISNHYTVISYLSKNANLFLITIIISLITYIFFMAFMKFYRRYSLESLMLVVIDKDLN